MPTGPENDGTEQSSEQDSPPGSGEMSQDREDRANEKKWLLIGAGVNLAATILGAVAVELVQQLL
ncbi:hypothetical protein [Streptomyces sp. NPDC020965]|uniref:hypothetical protein n=1 Tax=Streptomyces sp. NPDC020965 TaxID=3365105 RepID=UPI003795D666